jgi:arylformamidase
MNVIDVSVPMRPAMPVWPGDPPFEREAVSSIERGDPANVSRVRLGTHTGTHVDAPAHFLRGGAPVDSLALDALVGLAMVIESKADRLLTPADLGDIRAERVLFKTSNSARHRMVAPRFVQPFVSIGLELARELVRRGTRLVGVDGLSVEAFDAEPGFPVHRTLLEGGVVIVESLDLTEAAPGPYRLCCLPLRLEGADGAPARAVLLAP